jgi:predicted NAD/FAD-binding protein
MLWDIPRFHRHGRAFLEAPDESWTLRRFLDAHAYGESFRRHFILPMAGAVWSSSFGGALNFSAATFLRFFDNHGWLTLTGAPRWMTIEGGSRTYVSRIVESLGANARRNASVYRVSRRGPKDGGGVEIAAASGSERFDHAVLACHADEALALITAPSPDEGAALSSFSYSFNRTLLHRDASFLPARTDAWASWNTQIRDCRDDEAPVSMTYHVNRLQSIGGATQYNVTLNPRRDPKDVVAEMAYRHPLLDKKATDAQPMVRALSGRDRISYAGAYLYNGFHEDGVRAALDACAPFGATL